MQYNIENIKGGKLKITFELTEAEAARMRQRAMGVISQNYKMDGFRPGKVPLEVIKQKVGEATIEQEALLAAAKEFYPRLVTEEDLDVIGQPELQLEKAEPFVFSLTVVKLPEVSLGKWEKISLERSAVQVAESEITKVVEDIRDNRASEAASVEGIKTGDRVVMDFVVSVDKVAIEGGSQNDYSVIVGKGQLVPGFEENLLGLKQNEDKDFSITFPKDYHKPLASKPAEVKVKIKQVFARILPELNDDFAKGLGYFSSLKELIDKIKQNIIDEKTETAEINLEREMLEKLVDLTEFGELPDMLVDREAKSMVHELKHSLEHRGLNWVDYLASIKKDEPALLNEFKSQAVKRVKVALLTRQFVRQEKLEADDDSVTEELKKVLQSHQHDPKTIERFQTDEYKDYLRSNLTNKNVVSWLKEKLVKK
ncbi:trigger factor [Patescibacteria group bacterium]|nr:trigger factor [Patescibacteria group bacterium]